MVFNYVELAQLYPYDKVVHLNTYSVQVVHLQFNFAVASEHRFSCKVP